MNRLKEKYQKQIVKTIKKEFNLTNDLAVPRLTKIIINVGLKEGAGDKGIVKKVSDYISLIAGQKAIITRARMAEAAFKIRKNDPIGVKVTLRRKKMYEFFDKFVSIVLPRVRDFQGVSKSSFDGRGNYSIGLNDQTVFQEVDYDTIDTIRGLQINFVTNTDNNKIALRLLELFGMPFQKIK
ncbi:MAG: 50S ribosomal protein L5 [Patescibacteria group bacterium]|nr:50S ribosomal protein L5 [Patescibacteria group bacterium]